MNGITAQRIRSSLLYAIPIAFFAWLYAYGIRSWFQQDDFAWLILAYKSQSNAFADLLRVLFEPQAQGTIRPWSERLFFLVLFDRFGLDHRPYHLVVALTQCANLVLLQSVTLRLTRSRLAAVAAPCIWLATPGLATPLSWLSGYNQILCAFFLLLAFRLLVLYADSGAAKWWWAQCAVFVLGFGALEVNIVYPALAAAWCWLFARPHFRRALWLFPVSALYAFIHFRFAPKPTAGVYARHWDLSILPTYLAYWRSALVSETAHERYTWPAWIWPAAAALLGLAAFAFLVWAWRRGDRLPAFGFLWFSIVLAPLLPLRDHFSLYYLAVPSIGIALLASAALAHSLRSGWRSLLLCFALLGIHLFFLLPFSRATTQWHFTRGFSVRALVEGLERAHQLHPNHLIAISGVGSDLYWSGYVDRPYYLFGLTESCLVPGSERTIDAHPELGDLPQDLCSMPQLAAAAEQNRLVVYDFEGTRLRNITRRYIGILNARTRSAFPDSIDVGLPSSARFLGPGWFELQDNFRWMGRRAELFLAAPSEPGQLLALSGFCPVQHLQSPIYLTVSADGSPLGRQAVTRHNNTFAFTFPLPPASTGKDRIMIVLEVDRTVNPPNDGRALGLVFGKIGLRPPPTP
jgi:hypothetical protein